MRPSYLEPLESRIAPATLTVTPLIVDEGDEGTVDKVKHIQVKLDTAAAMDFTVHYTLVDGSAHSGTQFGPLDGQATDGTLTFTAGQTTATIDFIVNGDSTVNPDTSFTVKLDNATNGVGLPASDGTVTIWDDDRTVDFTVASLDQHVNEGTATNPGSFQYSATLSAPAQHQVTVTFQTSAHGTAYGDATTLGAAADYTAVTTTLVFAAGSLTPTAGATVNIKGDALPGPDEVFNATLSIPAGTTAFGAKLGTSSTTSTIVNDDGNDQSDLTVSLVNDTLNNPVLTSEGGLASFGIKLSRLSESPVTVNYHTSDGATHTATAGTDYVTALAGVKVIDSVLQDAIQVQVLNDTHVEGEEQFTLTLDGASVNNTPIGLGATTSATAKIVADELPKLVFIKNTATGAANGDVSVIESTATSARNADFLVKLAYLDAQGNVDANHHFDLLEAVTFDYTTVNGTAIGSAVAITGDYISKSGTLTFNSNTTDATAPLTISVPINSDTISEASETFTVKLSNVHGATIGDDTAVGTIADSTVVLKVAGSSVSEGNSGSSTAIFTITTGKVVPAGYQLVVDYATIDGTAVSSGTAGTTKDFQAIVPGQVTFSAGQTFKTLSVPIYGDSVIEANETFQLQISNARLVPVGDTTETPVNIADSVAGAVSGTGTIVNDDGTAISASITADAVSQAEGDAAAKANFTVHLSKAYGSTITVNYTVTKKGPDGVTTSFDDHFDIDPYTQNAPLPIAYTNDDVVGHDQTVTVTLKSLVSTNKTASLTPLVTGKTAKTTILEDDFYIQVLDQSALELDSGTSLLKFPVQLVNAAGGVITQGLDHAVSVSFSTADGTGAHGAASLGGGADFLARTGTVVFAAGEKEKTVDITIRGDVNAGIADAANNNAAGNEFFSVQLSAPTGGKLYNPAANAAITVDHSKATGTILNDDGTTAPTLTLVPVAAGVEAAAGVAGSPATFQAVLSGPSEQPVTFEYYTTVLQTPNAAVQADFTAIPQGSTDSTNPVSPTVATIASGQTTANLSVAVTADSLNEPTEFFGFNIANISGAANAAGSTLTVNGSIAPSNQPTISVDNASIVEGQSGTSNLTFTIKLSAATDQPVSFYVETLSTGGTATEGTDYQPVAKQLITIPAGSTQIPQTVTINGDTTTGEGNETFLLRISEVVNALPGTVQATGTILNDDATFTITAAASVHENDEVATLIVTRTGDTFGAADVTFQTAPGTAVSSGSFPDFTGGTGSVHFNDGQTTAEIKVALVENDRHEGNEDFTVQLTGVTNGILGAAKTSTVTILDNDEVPTATLSSPLAVVEKDSGTTAVTFTVTLDRVNEVDDIQLRFSTENGSATPGLDYTAVNNQVLIIPKGTLSKTFTVDVINDTTLDLLKTETFNVKVIQDPAVTAGAQVKFANNATSLVGTASIIDNDVAPQISVGAASFQEGGNSTFNVQLNHASDKPVTVKYYTVNGTAVSGADFAGKTSATAGVLTFAPGVTSMTIDTITTNDDALVEGNETFKLQLSTPTNATLNPAASSAIGTIVENDQAFLSINDVTIREGDNGTQDAVFTVSLLNSTVTPVTFKYQTGNGTALAGQDYIATAGSLTLGGATGAQTAQIAVKVIGDLIKEAGDETFKLLLSDVTVATLTNAFGTATIQNDGDSQTTISINSAVGVEGDPTSTANGDTKLTFTVTASDVLDNDVTFTVKASEIAKAANVARLGTDFLQPKNPTDVTKDLVLTIPKNNTGDTTHHSVTFDVTVKADQVFETTEFFNVTLSNIIGAQPGSVVGTGTIYDNDLYFSSRLIKWTDVDGDLVTLSVNKGNLGNVGFGFDSTSSQAGTMGGRILEQLNLVSPQAGLSFHRASLAITSTQQPNAAGQLAGDGLVNVGYIRANNYDTAPTLLELTGIDLASVAIDGDLSRINVGDLFNDYGITTLSAYSIGVKSSISEAGTTFTGVAQSQIIAGAGTIKTTNDISGVITVTGGTTGRIANLIVGGALRGTDVDDSARILVTGAITKASFHDIIGGTGKHSASLTQVDSTASLGSLTVTGNIVAGTGVESAHVLFPTIGSVTIGGSMSGSATGGGFISASNSLGSVTIGGNFDNGARILGGGLKNNLAINSVVVHGNVNNGQIKAGYTANLVDTFTNLAALEFKANADAQINSVQIDGSVLNLDILAGTDPAAATTAFNQDNAGLFSRIAKLVINGDVLPNTTAHYISAQSIGTILVQGAAKTATVAGTELKPGSNLLLKYAL